MKNKELPQIIAHGLGTYHWLKQDVTTEPLKICVHPNSHTVEASVEDACLLLQNFKINHEIVQRSYCNEQVHTYNTTVDCEDLLCSFKVRDTGRNMDNKVIMFLHGFLGTGEDWIPIMKSLSATTRCISIDLPCHGKSRIQSNFDKGKNQEFTISVEVIADALHKLISDITPLKVVLVGYSMGARIALYMALRCNKKISGAIIISGSPGLKDEAAKRTRKAQDDARAHYLVKHGLHCFMDMWYEGELWNSLRRHPHFKQIVGSREQHDDIDALAKSLSQLSLGRQPSLWKDLRICNKPLLFIVGENDQKFKDIAWGMCSEIDTGLEAEGNRSKMHEVLEVPECGHAVHLENPLPLINAVRKFLNKLDV